MRTQYIVLAAVSAVVIGCSTSDAAGDGSTNPTTTTTASPDGGMAIDPTALYFGTWAYQEGSAFVVACPGAPAVVQDLSTAGKDGTPGTFVLSPKADGTIHEVDGLGCEYDFVLRDSAAVAPTVETCETFPDGRGGFTRLTTDVTHKTTHDGRTMVVSAHAKVGGDCDLYVEGLATKNDATLPAVPAMNDATLYTGTWAYEKSSAMIVACSGKEASITDLATAENGAPGTFRVDRSGADLRETDGLGCVFDLSLVDDRMTSTRPETCDKLPMGVLTTRTTQKASWDGKHMVVAASAKVGTDCELFVSAIATKAQ